MTVSDLDSALSAGLVDRRLLDHPFYRRWEAGEVSLVELTAYAGQYRHFERYLPGFLGRLIAGLPRGQAFDLIAANLADEEGDPVPHVDLFERFATAVGAGQDAASPATRALLSTYDELMGEGVLAGLAGFVAYESQAAEIAHRKADGLRRHYGLDDHAVSFWEHHADVDARHGTWARDALERCTDTPECLIDAVRLAADAWWTMLDEREGAVQAG
jgi:pyrroloquinoline-quinone synthase